MRCFSCVSTEPAIERVAIFLNGAWIPSMADELETDLNTLRSRATGSRRYGLVEESLAELMKTSIAAQDRNLQRGQDRKLTVTSTPSQAAFRCAHRSAARWRYWTGSPKLRLPRRMETSTRHWRRSAVSFLRCRISNASSRRFASLSPLAWVKRA